MYSEGFKLILNVLICLLSHWYVIVALLTLAYVCFMLRAFKQINNLFTIIEREVHHA